jgi:hypothetical protein
MTKRWMKSILKTSKSELPALPYGAGSQLIHKAA